MKRIALLILSLLSFGLFSQVTFVSSFGTNPGNLNMYTYVPSGITGSAPVVVVLHGCTQTAAEAAVQTGWNKLADNYKFYIVYPEQKTTNNAQKCFNWFLTGDQEKDQGEDLSIKQMVDYMKANYSIDTTRIFATGLSAGAAMTEVLCATYPEIFKAGAVLAGGPYKSATNVFEASSAMQGMITKTPSAWANLVTAQNPTYTGAYPKMAFLHGTNDPVVNVNNLGESIKQWTAVHGADQQYDGLITDFGGNTLVVMTSYRNSTEGEIARAFSISNFGHAIPLDTGSCSQQGGQTATYAYDINFHSTWHVAHFFGLVDVTSSTLIINGPNCFTAFQTAVPYSVQQHSGSNYHWTVPVFSSVAGGQGTSAATINFYDQPGILSVYEMNSSGCLNGPGEIWMDTCANVGLEEAGKSEYKVYLANSRDLVIKGKLIEGSKVSVYDLLGNQILNENTSGENVSLHLPEYIKEGIYLLEIISGNKSVTQKIFIH
ncbi:MAG TPA: PHB depolymerase family esterase [Bacteroidia bacterium]